VCSSDLGQTVINHDDLANINQAGAGVLNGHISDGDQIQQDRGGDATALRHLNQFERILRGNDDTNFDDDGDRLSSGKNDEMVEEEVKAGTILPEHEATLKDIFTGIESGSFQYGEGGEILGEARLKFVRALQDGTLGDDKERIKYYKNLFTGLLYDAIIEDTGNYYSAKEDRIIESAVGVIVDEFEKSLDTLGTFFPDENLIVTEEQVNRDAGFAKDTLAELFEAIDEDTLPMSAKDFFSKFESVFEDDPTIDAEKTLKDIENAILSSYDSDQNNPGLRELIEDYGLDGESDRRGIVEELQTSAINSRNYGPVASASEIFHNAVKYSNSEILARRKSSSSASKTNDCTQATVALIRHAGVVHTRLRVEDRAKTLHLLSLTAHDRGVTLTNALHVLTRHSHLRAACLAASLSA
jgi:hypothetical protein